MFCGVKRVIVAANRLEKVSSPYMPALVYKRVRACLYLYYVPASQPRARDVLQANEEERAWLLNKRRNWTNTADR